MRRLLLVIILISASPIQTRAEFPWQDSDKYRECGQSCLYEKSNENISLHAIYILRKIDSLEKTTHYGSEKRKSEIIQKTLGEFCLKEESPDQCFKRYKWIQIMALRKMKAALIQNSDSAAKLYDHRKNPLLASKNEQSKNPQIPYIPTFKDIQNEYNQETQQLNHSISEQYQNWVGNIQTEPSKEDFVLFKRVPRDHELPGGEQTVILDKSCGQPICYDITAYKEAMQVFAARKKTAENDLQKMRTHNPKSQPEMPIPSEEEKNYRSFKDARETLIQVTNYMIQDGKIAVPDEITFSGSKDRNIASKTAPKKPTSAVKVPSNHPDVYVRLAPDRLEQAIQKLQTELESD